MPIKSSIALRRSVTVKWKTADRLEICIRDEKTGSISLFAIDVVKTKVEEVVNDDQDSVRE